MCPLGARSCPLALHPGCGYADLPLAATTDHNSWSAANARQSNTWRPSRLARTTVGLARSLPNVMVVCVRRSSYGESAQAASPLCCSSFNGPSNHPRRGRHDPTPLERRPQDSYPKGSRHQRSWRRAACRSSPPGSRFARGRPWLRARAPFPTLELSFEHSSALLFASKCNPQWATLCLSHSAPDASIYSVSPALLITDVGQNQAD